MTARLTITPVTPADPHVTPGANIVDGPNGGVKVDTTVTPAPIVKAVEGDRPAWLPEKFKTAEEFAKAYGELEKKQSTPAAAVKPVAVTVEAVTKAGLNLPALDKEYATTGELSAETLQALADKGFDKASVDSYLNGQKAIAEKLVGSFETVAGGKEALAATLSWAKANLTADDAAAYNAAIDSGDLRLAKLALQGVVAQYTAANGKEPALLSGGEGARTTDATPYESTAQMVADMRKPEYKKDPAFRAKVDARLEATNFKPR